MKKILSLLFFVLITASCQLQNTTYKTATNIQYYPDETANTDDYIKERCVLDVYYPTDKKDFPTIVWFHGGGLSGGEKEMPDRLKNQGMAIVGVNYRLHPRVKAPTYIEDAAAAVAWVFKHIEQYGGDATQIYLTGHSAGGYLVSMVGMDKKWLKVHNVDANDIAGLIPLSGHTITHFTVRAERGIKGTQPIVDELAPLYHVRKDAPPLLLITGDRELELLGRYEENAYMMRMMKEAGHKDTRIMELDGYDHGMVEPALPLIIKEIERLSKK